jgi:hypothetical protein
VILVGGREDLFSDGYTPTPRDGDIVFYVEEILAVREGKGKGKGKGNGGKV